MKEFARQIYYLIKPIIPKPFQIYIRRHYVRGRRNRYAKTWPIDRRAARPPRGWRGWPNGKRFGIILTHDVDTFAGQKKCRLLADIEVSLGFRSSFNFVAEGYPASMELHQYLIGNGFEIGLHGLRHDGNMFRSKKIFQKEAVRINRYLKEWKAVGFRSPSMYHNLEWIGNFEIDYDCSTFDTDPFEPQPDGVGTIFPFIVKTKFGNKQYFEFPYTLPQDFTIFILMEEKSIRIWREKLDWIAEHRGMALLNTHPDYMSFNIGNLGLKEYQIKYYKDFLEYVKCNYEGQYWHGLPRELAFYLKNHVYADKCTQTKMEEAKG